MVNRTMENRTTILVDELEHRIIQGERLRILIELIELWEGDIPLGIVHVIMNETKEDGAVKVEVTTGLIETITEGIRGKKWGEDE